MATAVLKYQIAVCNYGKSKKHDGFMAYLKDNSDRCSLKPKDNPASPAIPCKCSSKDAWIT
jgi:hypothetical protein